MTGRYDKNKYEQINREVNALAYELIEYNPDDINSLAVKRIQKDILEKMGAVFYEMPTKIDEYNRETRFFPLVKKYVRTDLFIDTLITLLGKTKNGKWYYDSDKGKYERKVTFITAFKYILGKKLKDYSDDPIPFDWNDEKNVQILEKHLTGNSDYRKDPAEIVTGQILDFALIIKYSQEIKKESIKRQKCYQGFFTIDITKEIKKHEDVGKLACKNNDLLFPRMLIMMLIHLMEGEFTHMHDVVVNKLRPGVNLEQRLKLVEECLEFSHPTISKYNKDYNKLRSSTLKEPS